MNALDIKPGVEFRLHPGTRWDGRRLALRRAVVVRVHRFSDEAKHVLIETNVDGETFYPTLPEFVRAVDFGAPQDVSTYRRRRVAAVVVLVAGVVVLWMIDPTWTLVAVAGMAGVLLVWNAWRAK